MYLQELKGRVANLRPILTRISKREQIVQEKILLDGIEMNSDRLLDKTPKSREDRFLSYHLIFFIGNF